MGTMDRKSGIEIWKNIKGYPDYQISNFGRVKSLKYGKEKIKKGSKNSWGYLQVNLWKEGKHKAPTIHRLVALAFLDNPNNLPQINHKDEDKTNNRVENLEWCDNKYNMNYGTRTERTQKPILQFTKNGNFIKQWCSVLDVERELGFNNGNISSCCNGKLKTAYNYKWCFLRNYVDNFLADWLVEYQNEVAV